MASFENDVVVAKNLNFNQAAAKPHLGVINAAGKLPIGTGNSYPTPEILGGSITSPDSSLTVGYSSPNITLQVSGGTTVGKTITGDTGGALPPTSGNWNILGGTLSAGTNASTTSGSGSTLTITSINTAKWIVDPTANRGTHTTIAGALSAASSGQTIFIRPGTYTENITLKAGVDLATYTADAFTGNVSIVGTVTASYSGTASISGIRFQTNSANAVSLTGANATILNLNDCYFNCTNATGISSAGSNSSSRINLQDCKGDLTTTGIGLFDVSNGGIDFRNCFFSNSGGSTTSSTLSSSAILSMRQSVFSNPITTSGTSQIGSLYTSIDTLTQNVTALTVNGTGSSSAYFTRLASGTATPLSIGAAANLITNILQLSSSNATATTGAGTLTYNLIVMDTTLGALGTTTLVPKGIVGMQSSTSPAAGFIGEVIESFIAAGSAVSVSSGSGTNFTSISLTPGVWDVTVLCILGGGAVTGTIVQMGTSTSSTGVGLLSGSTRVEGTWFPTAATSVNYILPPVRISLSATTTYYANIAATYTVGTLLAYGRITAIRAA